jgi:hypothetical protein
MADWHAAIAEFAAQRKRVFDVVLAYDRGHCDLKFGKGDAADRAREGSERARERGPTLGVFGVLEAQGPDNSVADEGARRAIFGRSAPWPPHSTAGRSDAILPWCWTSGVPRGPVACRLGEFWAEW